MLVACRWQLGALQPKSVQLWQSVLIAAGHMVWCQGGNLGCKLLHHPPGSVCHICDLGSPSALLPNLVHALAIVFVLKLAMILACRGS